MTRLTPALILAALVAAAAPAVLAAGVNLGAAGEHRLGVVTERLAPAHFAVEVDAFAKVLDPEPLVQLVSDLQTAEAAAAASRAEAERSRALHAADGGVAAKDLEAAVAQAKSDALHASLLRRRLGLEWGPGVARMSPAARDKLVRALSDGQTALVHVDTHNNEGQTGARFVRIDVGDGSVRGAVLGPARAAEPRLQSSGLIVQVDGPSAILLSVGLTQSAHIETANPQSGVVVPRTAVIRHLGADWVYVRAPSGGFERRMLTNPSIEADGLFVAQGLSAGDEVAVKGAAALFSAEMTAQGSGR